MRKCLVNYLHILINPYICIYVYSYFKMSSVRLVVIKFMNLLISITKSI